MSRSLVRNQHSPKAAMIAALDTRRKKEADPGVTQLRAWWTERAEEMGFDPARLRDAIGRAEPVPMNDSERQTIEDRLLGAAGLTAHDSSFQRNEILRAWCDALPAGAPIEQIEDLVELLIDRMETAPLHEIAPGKGDVIRNASGRTISTLPAQERWTTFELLDTERHALRTAHDLLEAGRAVCDEGIVLSALRGSRSLSDEQVAAVIQMTTSGNGVDVLTAPAGAGKTYAFATARDAWERARYRVIGAAHTGVAADELAMAAGITSTTIARLLIAIDRGEPGGPESHSHGSLPGGRIIWTTTKGSPQSPGRSQACVSSNSGCRLAISVAERLQLDCRHQQPGHCAMPPRLRPPGALTESSPTFPWSRS